MATLAAGRSAGRPPGDGSGSVRDGIAGRQAGRARGPAARPRWPTRRRRGEVDPGRLGEADERRRPQSGRELRRGRDSPAGPSPTGRRPRARPAGPSAEDDRVVLDAQDRRPGPRPARRADRPPPRSRPDRAAPSARRGRGRSCPSPRCSRWRRAAARHRTGRTARDRPGGRCRGGRGSRRCGRPSRRAARRGSRARTRAPRGRSSFEADSWLAGVEKTIPTRPRSASGGRPRGRRCRRSSTWPSSLARTTRGMNPAAASASVDLPGAGPAGHADPLAGQDREVDPRRAPAPAGPDSGSRGPRSAGVPARRRGVRVVIGEPR